MAASLPMYDWPQVRPATDAWWMALARAFRAEGLDDVPERLLHDVKPADLWGAPGLFLSQTCGYPLTHDWAGRLRVVATPHYDVDGCEGADYCSFILVRRATGIVALEALRGGCAAFNGEDSQSGYSALRAVFAPLVRNRQFFGSAVRSGSHLGSMQQVAGGAADVCAVDAVVWALAQRHHPEFAGELAVIARSPSAPGLPYVTSPAHSDDRVARMWAGLRTAFADPALSDIRAELSLCGVSVLGPQAYDRIRDIERQSIQCGYSALP